MKKKELIQILLLSGIFFYVFHSLALVVWIDGNSMYPTLHDHDAGVVSAININKEHIKRFDILVLYDKKLDKNIVKRVIGLPGEIVTYKKDKLYIDGKYYPEPYLNTQYIKEAKKKYNSNLFTQDFRATVDKDQLFVMGDNRLFSMDSRLLGTFSYKDVIGKRGIILYPLKNMQWLD